MKKPLHFLASLAIASTALLMTLEQARAESTYNAACKVFGDGITLTRTGEIVLEQRLVKFKPIENYKPQSGQRGVCIIKKDPPGYKWISCQKLDGSFISVRPASFIPDQVQHMSPRSITGACKVKL